MKTKRIYCILIAIFCLLFSVNINAQVVSGGTVQVRINNKSKQEEKKNVIPVYKPTDKLMEPGNMTGLSIADSKYYALLIGINNYSDPLVSSLDKPIRDAELFYKTITDRYTFKKEDVIILRDATIAEIIAA